MKSEGSLIFLRKHESANRVLTPATDRLSDVITNPSAYRCFCLSSFSICIANVLPSNSCAWLNSCRKEVSILSRELIESEHIFKGAVFTVERDRIREENGYEIVREIVRHSGGAGCLPLFPDGRVALVKQYRHPARRELLEIPAGKIEVGESPIECAAREVEQETGFRPGRIEVLADFYSTPGFCEERLYVYLATELKPVEQNLDHDEFVEVVYLPLEEAVAMAERNEIEDSKTIIALLLAKRRT